MKKLLLASLLLISMSAEADIIVVVNDNYRAPSDVVVYNGVCLSSAFTKHFPASTEGGKIQCYSKELILYKQFDCHVGSNFWKPNDKKAECVAK